MAGYKMNLPFEAGLGFHSIDMKYISVYNTIYLFAFYKEEYTK